MLGVCCVAWLLVWCCPVCVVDLLVVGTFVWRGGVWRVVCVPVTVLSSSASRVADERRRQKQAMLDKLQEKQARAQRQLKRKQELELAKQTAEQQQSLSHARAQVETKTELAVLTQVLATAAAATAASGGDGGGDGGSGDGAAPAPQLHHAEVGEAIEMLLRDRQSREVSELLATQYNERTDVLRLCLEEVFDRRRDERAAVTATMKERIAAANGDGDAIAAAEADAADAMQALEAKFAMEQSVAQQTCLDQLGACHAT